MEGALWRVRLPLRASIARCMFSLLAFPFARSISSLAPFLLSAIHRSPPIVLHIAPSLRLSRSSSPPHRAQQNTSLLTLSLPASITYLTPRHLSPDPSTRFTELFSLRPRWKDTEMVLFLDDLVGGDKKKRDAMVLKFVRKVKENDGTTTWTARNLW